MDLRKFPRYPVIVQQQVLHLCGREVANRRVLSKNISASGFCFSSSKSYELGATVFVHLNGQIIEDIAENRAGILKAGNYFLARVVWCRQENGEYITRGLAPELHPLKSNLICGPKGPSFSRGKPDPGNPFYEIGCAFVDRQEANPLTMDLFTRCLNQYSVQNIQA